MSRREPPLRPASLRGSSCARTILGALRDITEGGWPDVGCPFRPQVLHVVGAGEAELSMDFAALARGLTPGARVVLVGPHATAEGDEGAREELLGPAARCGLQISVFPQTYQRYITVCHAAEAPELVVLFHPGLDIHYFAWYSCIKHWADAHIPVLLTAYRRPEGLGETPALVQTLLETLVGSASGPGLRVMETENPDSADDGSFNAGYFVFVGSHGSLPALPEDLYFGLFQALREKGYPFAPRVGYLDVGDEGRRVTAGDPRLVAAVAEGAVRGAKAGEDACDDATAQAFARLVLDTVLGPGTGEAWEQRGFQRAVCENCGEGYDSEIWHRSICAAVGMAVLRAGDSVRLANLHKEDYNGREGLLVQFNRHKQRWMVRLGEKEALFKAVNLQACSP